MKKPILNINKRSGGKVVPIPLRSRKKKNARKQNVSVRHRKKEIRKKRKAPSLHQRGEKKELNAFGSRREKGEGGSSLNVFTATAKGSAPSFQGVKRNTSASLQRGKKKTRDLPPVCF